MYVVLSIPIRLMRDFIYLDIKEVGGLRSVENTYKEIKVKAAVKLKINEDPRMKLVK